MVGIICKNYFYALAEECYNLTGAHFATLTKNEQESLTTTRELRASTELQELLPSSGSQSNISEIISNAPTSCQGDETVGVDLATAVAVKTLYEKIRRFNDYAGTSKQIQYLYLLQTVLQILLTVIFFTFSLRFKDIKGTAKCSVDEYFPVILLALKICQRCWKERW